MASTKVLQLNDKVAKLQEYGSIGYRSMDDPFFVANNTVIFKPFVRLGVYRYDDESLCHKSWVFHNEVPFAIIQIIKAEDWFKIKCVPFFVVVFACFRNRVRCNIPKCNEEFDTIFAYENHYNSLHRFLCAQCSKNLPSAHLLDLHLSEKHDSFFAVQAERKPMVWQPHLI